MANREKHKMNIAQNWVKKMIHSKFYQRVDIIWNQHSYPLFSSFLNHQPGTLVTYNWLYFVHLFVADQLPVDSFDSRTLFVVGVIIVMPLKLLQFDWRNLQEFWLCCRVGSSFIDFFTCLFSVFFCSPSVGMCHFHWIPLLYLKCPFPNVILIPFLHLQCNLFINFLRIWWTRNKLWA